MKSSLSTIRNASHLLPTGGELVRDLADEIELLQKELERRDKVVDGLVETLQMKVEACRKMGAPYDSGFCAPLEIIVLKNIQNEFQQIHDELRTESEAIDA